MFDNFQQQSHMSMIELYIVVDIVSTSSFSLQEITTAEEARQPPVLTQSNIMSSDHEFEQTISPPTNHPDSNVDFATNLSDDDDMNVEEDDEIAHDSSSDECNIEPPIMNESGPSQPPFWNNTPHYSYIDWSHPDQEMWYGGLDVPNSWRVGDELYVGLRFHTKADVQMAVKHYSMNAHQTFVVLESGLKVLSVRCPNSNEGCPWKLRASMSTKYNNKWVIKKWGGRHTCINAILSQDHNKLDSEFICSCILGMVREDASVSTSLIQERISGQFNYKVVG
ncbi:uncharacterized protein LOC109800018 [Cajanus cajan]|uniref:uncharacterized protein LOC109800018 n=1 Tax=Cajanus cajan TaxID=3821 RepID=UPI0010FB9898|nr:uncharacterized protein LOC109800018 [Cajanus cajan]